MMKVAKSKHCVIYKDFLLVKSGELTRIIQADPKLETLYAEFFCGCVIKVISD